MYHPTPNNLESESVLNNLQTKTQEFRETYKTPDLDTTAVVGACD
jgi:hypothetical protein